MSRSCVYRGQRTPDCRSARNNLYSGIPHVSSGLDHYLLPVQYFPLLPVQCFSLLPVQYLPLLPIRISDSDLLVRIGDPDLPFATAIPIPVSGPRFRSPFCFLFRIPFRFLLRFPLRFPFQIPFCFPFRFTYRILSRSLDFRPTPVPVPVRNSVSVWPSSLLLVLLPHGVALYRRQSLITDSYSARLRRVRSCGSRPRPVTLCCVSG